jgi:rSAM/selenodomain-associated transferase 1
MKSAAPDRLLLFTRYPQPGATKTRLIPVMGPDGAADLQRRLSEHVLARMKPLARAGQIILEVHYDGAVPAQMRAWLGGGFAICPQGAGDIGARMVHALQMAFAAGSRRVLLIGSDIPGIDAALVMEARAQLDRNDLVLGPALDGGFYLIGFTHRSFPRAASRIFAGVPWGSKTVLAETMERARRMALRTHLLPPLADVDRPEDLSIWEAQQP